MKTIKLKYYGEIDDLRDKEIVINGEPLILPFPGENKDYIAILEIKEVKL